MGVRRSFLSSLLEFVMTPPSATVKSTAQLGQLQSNSSARPEKVVRQDAPMNDGRTRVSRAFTSLWQDRQWQRRAEGYTGYYRTRFGAYEGMITERYRGFLEFYIKNPPDCLRRHSHAACFWPKGKGLVYVHFSRPARTPDEGIMAIEQILNQAHQLEAQTTKR